MKKKHIKAKLRIDLYFDKLGDKCKIIENKI